MSLEQQLKTAAKNGLSLSANFDAERFHSLFGPGAQALDEALDGEDRERLVRAYLRLGQESLARGYILSAKGLPAHLLLKLAPEQLPRLDAQARMQTLAELWNLSEGVCREPRWMQSYLGARAQELDSLGSLRLKLIELLEPVLAPGSPSTFSANIKTAQIDTRALDDEFLPGDMFLCAPTVVAIIDRARPVCLGLILRENKKSQLIGPLGMLGDRDMFEGLEATDEVAKVERGTSGLRLNGQSIDLPLLGQVHQHTVAPAGFIVASAVDSQRLWVWEAR